MDAFFKIANKLEQHHGIFAQLWSMGEPTFTDEIETAAVAFDKEGGFISFLFNENFYNSLSEDEVAAVVAHECLHVILNHGSRGKGMHPQLCNIAEDVVINEMLVNSFGFSRKLPVFEGIPVEVDGKIEKHPACFIDTVFKDKKKGTIAANREFEYYYTKLLEDNPNAMKKGNIKIMIGGQPGDGKGTPVPLDDHSQLPQEVIDAIKDALKKISKEEVDKLADIVEGSGEKDKTVDENGNKKDEKAEKEKEAGDKSKDGKPQAGGRQAVTGSGFEWIRKVVKVKVNRKWEQIVKKWVIKAFTSREREQWVKSARRYSILDANHNFLLPADHETDDIDISRIDVVFFMDVSGSCHGDSERFFGAAKSVPRDKFKLDVFAFDTGITKVKIEDDKLPYGGGTSFDQLEAYLKQRKDYPTLVFCLTDGYGTQVKPKYPKRWHVFLTQDNKGCFPKDCNFHKFEDFESK